MTTAATSSKFAKYLPILGWLPGYQSGWLRFDLVAGLIAAAVVTPQAMAYATIAGLPVQVGLYVALAPMLVYALLGSSRRLSVSSTSALSILTGSALLTAVGPSGNPADAIIPAATLAFLVGIFLILASLLRLGLLANFISHPVLTGFKAGIGAVIFVSQLGKVLGLSIPGGSSVLKTTGIILTSLNQINWPTVALAAITLAILILLPRFVPRIPAALVAVAAGITLSAFVNLDGFGISLIGDIPTGLPSFSLPNLSLVGSLWLPALGIALMSFTESTAAARAFRGQGEPAVDANHELFALGMANIAGGFFQAYPAGGGTSQTAVNANAGAKTQLAELVTVAVVALILLFLAPFISLMPEATLGALVLVAAAGLVQIGEFREMAQIRRLELIWALLAFSGVIVLGILEGILVAILISLLTLLVQVDHPPVYALGRKPGTDVFRPLGDHPQDETFPGLLLVRTEGRLFFANISRVIDRLWVLIHQDTPQVVLLDCDAIPDIEYTALKSLIDFEEQLQNAGIVLWLAKLNPEALYMIRHSSLAKKLGDERMYVNCEQAVEAYARKLEKRAAID
ncbi:MAG: sulfate permease [Ardenticatenaceae bacterium]|nr:sulfate permease [Ardenticatenaceae bacterium]